MPAVSNLCLSYEWMKYRELRAEFQHLQKQMERVKKENEAFEQRLKEARKAPAPYHGLFLVRRSEKIYQWPIPPRP